MKQNNKTVITMNLDTDFVNETIKKTMMDEYEIASKKWNVRLGAKDKDLVIENSIKQLIRKVNENTRLNWDYTTTLLIRVNSLANTELTLPTTDTKIKTSVIRTRSGWEIDTESREEAISIHDFKNFYQECILRWARTAVFYGVASYT